MGIFNFLQSKKNNCVAVTNIGNAVSLNINTDIIMGRKINQPNMLLFYRKQWAGKGDSGVEWITLTYSRGNCLISFKSAYAGYGESLPSLENIKQKNCSISFDEIREWEYQKIFDFLGKEFDVILTIDDCITDDEYICWLKKLRLLSCVVNRIYKFNNGFADCACCIFHNNQKYYFYLKELGNNKGYAVGQEVYEINQDKFVQFESGKLDRNALFNPISDLPAGDQDWLDDAKFIDFLISYISGHNICENSQHHFTDLKHFNGGSECRCKKCGLVVKFNRGWPDRIDPNEMDEFLQKYKGSKIDF